jgi:hypothetical protein
MASPSSISAIVTRLFGVEVGSNPTSLAVLELDHRAVRRFKFGLACSATRADAADCDRPVDKVPDLRIVGMKLREGLVQVSERVADALVCPVYRRFSPSIT